MVEIRIKSECCGCSACMSICKHHAISMVRDQLGFEYPIVNKELCTNCNLCNHVCQFKKDYNRYENYSVPLMFSGRLKDEKQLMKSQSGGAFYAIARYVLNNNGIIYGAAFDKDWSVCHLRASNYDELEKLRMTKYVQSHIGHSYQDVKDDLIKDRYVLFTGTACQIAGLKSFIPQKLHEKLLTIDVICHGVPSPQIWLDYIKYLELRYKSSIIKACFRDKRYGWHGAKESFLFSSGKEITSKVNNYLYFSGLTVRDCCKNCHFTNLKRVSDITIGDFWGADANSDYEKDQKGASILLINSDKGKKIFYAINNTFSSESIRIDIGIKNQPQLQHPTELNEKRTEFIDDYSKYGFKFVARKYKAIGINAKKRILFEKSKQLIKLIKLH